MSDAGIFEAFFILLVRFDFPLEKLDRLLYLKASGDKGLVLNLSEHVAQKVLVELSLLLLEDNLLELEREVVGVAALDVALQHVVCNQSHGGECV